MDKNKLAQEVIKKIKERSVKPKPRWQFLASNYSLWFAGVVAIVMGGVSISVIIYLIKDNDWQVYEQMDDNLFSFIFLTLPYLWLIFLVVFALAAHFNLKNTKKGYRLRLPTLLSAMILLSFVLGGAFYSIGIGKAIDMKFKDKYPVYYKLLSHRDTIWKKHSRGFLGGTIIQVNSENDFYLIDMEGNVWGIDASKAIVTNKNILGLKSRVRMIGKRYNEKLFQAKFIAPFDFPRKLMPNLPEKESIIMPEGMIKGRFERNPIFNAY